MKRLYYLSFLVFLSTTVNAQIPTLTRANYYELGDSIISMQYFSQNPDLTEGEAGENIVWDFRTFFFPEAVDTIRIVDPSTTVFKDYPPFQKANLSSELAKGDLSSRIFYDYLLATEESISFIGREESSPVSESFNNHCTDYRKELIFPFTYNQQFEDSLACTVFDASGSGWHTINGNQTVLADGYGTLHMPGGYTYENVLRVKTILVERDSNFIYTDTSRTEYFTWYSSDYKGPIAIYRKEVDLSYLDHRIIQSDLNTSTEKILFNHQIKIYPTLLTDNDFFIENKLGLKIDQLKVFSIDGQLLHEQMFEQPFLNKKVSVNLMKGTYIVSLFIEGQPFMFKIFKQ